MKITITNNKVETDKPIPMLDLTNILLNVILAAANTACDEAPEDIRQEVRENLYDIFNDSFTAFLETFIPDRELRSDLTADAIYAMENELLEIEAKKVDPIGTTTCSESEEQLPGQLSIDDCDY